MKSLKKEVRAESDVKNNKLVNCRNFKKLSR